MYKCKDCGKLFDEPRTYIEDKTPYGGMSEYGFIDTYTGCPKCGGIYEEVFLCESCNKYVDFVDDESICEDCCEEKGGE